MVIVAGQGNFARRWENDQTTDDGHLPAQVLGEAEGEPTFIQVRGEEGVATARQWQHQRSHEEPVILTQ